MITPSPAAEKNLELEKACERQNCAPPRSGLVQLLFSRQVWF